MTIQPPDLKKMREVADRATPGPWLKDKYGQLRNADGKQIDAQQLGVSVVLAGERYPEALANAELMNLCNPQAILALLDAYEAIARDAERMRAALVQIEQWSIKGRHEEDFEAIEKAARHATKGE